MDAAFDGSSGDLVAVATDEARREWVPLNSYAKDNIALITRALNGSNDYAVASAAGDLSILRVVSDVEPPVYYLFDLTARTVKKQVSEYPELAAAPFTPTAVITPVARDGLPLPSYLTLPKVPAGWNATGGRLPLVVLTRAAPWLRDAWTFNPTAQALANRGYAVLRVNFRGSSGFGRNFSAAAVDEWVSVQDKGGGGGRGTY